MNIAPRLAPRRLLHLMALACCCALSFQVRAHDIERPRDQTLEVRITQDRNGGTDDDNNSVVTVGGNSSLAKGKSADSVVSVFGSSTSEGDVSDSVVSVLGNSRVTGPVGDTVVAVGGDAYVSSKVHGDVVAVLGNVELGPEADIGGDVIAIGGVVKRDPAAVVHGDVQNVAGNLADAFSGLRPWVVHCLLYGRPLAIAPGIGWAWGLALGFLALYLVLALLFRGAVARCVETLETQPGRSLLAALLTVLLTPVAFIVLCITVIGVAVVPFLAIGLFCAGLFGRTVVLAVLGRRAARLRDATAGQMLLAVLVGGAIVLALYLIPFVGFIVYNLLGIIGLGVVIYTLILAARGPSPGQIAATAAAAPATAAPATAVPASAAPATAGKVAPEGVTAAAAAAVPPAAAAQSDAIGRSEPPPSAGPQVSTAGATSAGTTAADTSALDASVLPRAGFWIRMGALALDALLVGIVLGMLWHHSPHLELLTLATYGAVMWKLRGTTIGGVVCSLKVARLDGRPIDWATAIVRALGCFLSLAVVGLGFLWIVFDDGKQAWHDKIAGTVVVRVPKSLSLV
jgi:uncharacterized RDD family membrane protein YckC